MGVEIGEEIDQPLSNFDNPLSREEVRKGLMFLGFRDIGKRVVVEEFAGFGEFLSAAIKVVFEVGDGVFIQELLLSVKWVNIIDQEVDLKIEFQFVGSFVLEAYVDGDILDPFFEKDVSLSQVEALLMVGYNRDYRG